jgi:hypothetical protein
MPDALSLPIHLNFWPEVTPVLPVAKKGIECLND